MKEFYKWVTFILLFFIVTINSFGQTTGDYRTTISGSCIWTNIAAWQIFDGTTWITASEYPGQNASAGTVTISDNTLMTLDQSISNTINAIVISANTANTSLTFGGTYTLNVASTISFSTPSLSSKSNTLDISTGTLTCSNLIMNSTTDNTKTQKVIISTGKLDVSNTITIPAANQNMISITSVGILRIGNQFISTGTTSFDPTSTVEFYSTTAQSIPNTNGYGNVLLSGSGSSKTVSAPLLINGNLIINSGVELNDGGNTITGNGGTFTLSAGATFTTMQTALFFPQAFTISLNNSSTVNFNGSGNYSIPAIPTNYGNIVFNSGTGNTITIPNTITTNGDFVINSGTVTLASPINVTGNISINSGTLNDGGKIITGNSSGTFSVAAGATFTTLQTSLPFFPQNATIYLNNSSIVNYNGSGNYSIPATPTSYGLITINGTSTVTLTSPITVNGNFTVNTGVTLNDGGFIVSGNGGTFTLASGATYSTIQTAAPFFPQNFTINLNSNSTVIYSGVGNYSIPAIPTNYGSISLNGTSTLTTSTIALSGGITINGNLSVNQNIELNDSGFVISGVIGKQCTISSGASYSTSKTASPFPTNMTINLDANSTVNFNGNGNYTIGNLPVSFGNVVFNGTGTHTLSSAITINGNLIIKAGTLADGGKQITGNSTGLLTMMGGTGLALGSTTVATTFPTLFTSANISLTPTSGSSTVTYNSNQQQSISSVPVYSNLTLSSSTTSSIQKIIDGNLSINGTLTVNAQNTLNDNGYAISCNGSIVINTNGSHTGTGKIKITGTANQYISGAGSINNIEIAKPSGIAYINSTVTVAPTPAFTITGDMILTTGTLNLNGRILATTGNILISSGAVLAVTSNSILQISNGKTITNNDGTFSVSGNSTTIAKVTINGSSGAFSYIQSGLANLSANYYEFDNCELFLNGGIITGNLSYGTFSTIGTNSNEAYINFDGFTQKLGPKLVEFNIGPKNNVRNATSSDTITFAASSGTFTGNANEDNATKSYGHVIWSSGSTYYSKTTNKFSTLSNWSTNSDGTGTSPSTSSELTNKTNSFIIQNGHTITDDVAGLDVYHLEIKSGGTLTIGNNSTARTLTIEENIVDSGVVNIGTTDAIHTINLLGDLTVAGIFNLYNTATQAANISFNNSSTQLLKGTPTSLIFNNITFAGMTNVIPSYALTIQGNVTFGANTTFTAGSFRHFVKGNWTGNASSVHTSSGTIVFNGTTQTIANTSPFYNLEISGGGTTIFGGSPITVSGNILITNNSTLTIGNSTTSRTINVTGDIQVDNGSTINVGAYNATNILTTSGDLIINGIFDMYKAPGQVCNTVFTGTNLQTIKGTGITCRFNVITVNKGTDLTSIVQATRIITQQAPATSNNLVLTNGTFKLSSASSLTPYFGSQTICSATSRLWINNPNAIISSVGAGNTTTAQTATVNGVLLVEHGTFKYGSGNDRLNLTAATSSLRIEGADATVTLYGGLNNNTTNPATVAISNGNLIFDCQRLTSGGNNFTTATHLVDLRGLITFTGGRLTIVNPSANPTADLNATLLIWSINPASTFDGSTIQFGDGLSNLPAGSPDGFDFRTNNTSYLGNIVLNTGSSGIQIAKRHVKFIGGNVYIGGNDSLYNGSELQFNGQTMFLKGNLTNNGIVNTSTTNSLLYLNGTAQQKITGSGTFTTGSIGCVSNLTVDNTSGSTPAVDLQCPLTIQTAYTLTHGSLNTSGSGTLTLGINSASLSITRTDGSLLATPIWNISNVICNIIYNTASGTITTGNELPKTANGPVSTLTANNTAGGVLLSNTETTIKTSLTLMNGIFNLQDNTLYLNGLISRNGTSQIGTLSTGTGASIIFGNTSALTIPTGSLTSNPTELSYITMNSSSSVTLSSGQNILLRGAIILGNGIFSVGAGTLSFHLSDNPIVKTGGTLTTTTASSLVFGTSGNTSGAAFTIPTGAFTSTTTVPLLNLTINRDNKITLPQTTTPQTIALSGTLSLIKGELDNNNWSFTTSGTIPFSRIKGTLTIGSSGSMTFNPNTATATIPDGLFTSAPVSITNMTINRAGGIILGNQEINITGVTTLSSGIISVMNADLQINTISGTPSASRMIVVNGSGYLKRSIPGISTSTSYTYPIGDNTGTAEYSPVTLTFTTNSTAGMVGLKAINAKHPNNTESNDYLNRYWTFSTSGLTNYTYRATYTYTLADYIGSSENGLLVQDWNGSTWIPLETSSTNSTSHTLITGTTYLTQATGLLNNNSYSAYATNKYFWSKTSGTWNGTTVWEYSTSNTDPGIGSGTPTTIVPTFANSKGITIRPLTTVTLSTAQTADQLIVNGTLNMAGNSLTLYDETGVDLTLTSGGIISTTGGQILANTSGISIDISGTYKTSDADGFSGSTTTSITSTNNPTVTLNTGSTIEYTGTTQTISTASTYSNLKISTAGIKTVSNSATINGDLTISAGSLAFGTSPITVTVTGNLSATIIDMSQASHNLILGGATNILPTLTTGANQSTITYNRAGNQTIFSSINYRNLVISGTGTKTVSPSPSGPTINNDLRIGNSATFADGGYACSVKGNVINNGIHSGTGKIVLNGTGDQTISCGTATFGNLEINNSLGALSILGNQITIGSFTIVSGTTLTQNAITTGLNITGNTTIGGTIVFEDNSGTKSFNRVQITSTGKWYSAVIEDFDLNGDFQIVSGGAFTPNTGTYTFGGDQDQTIDVPSGFNVSLNKTGGIVSSSLPTLYLSNIVLKSSNIGIFQAPANLFVSGNITYNSGTLNWGNNVTLNGSTTQILNGKALPSFTNFTTNNTTTGDAIILNTPIIINGIFTLTDGIIKSDATNLITMGSSATIGGTPSDASFVDGPLSYTINSATKTTKKFPIGKQDKLRRVDIMIDQADATLNTYTCEYTRNSATDLHSLATGSGLTNVSSLGYWHISKTNETLDTSGNDNSLDSASIILYYLSDDGVTDPSHLFVAKSRTIGSVTEWINVGGTANASIVKSGLFHAFCDITLASDCSCNSLPISITEFTVQKKDVNVVVKWETASETNNDFFTVERSTDGKTWETVYTCKGAGNSTETNIYSFVDTEVEAGIIVYYRLKQTDYDGNSTYSKIQSIDIFSNSISEFTVYPNPSNPNNVNIIISSKEDKVILQVTDNIGRSIYNGSIDMNKSTTRFFKLADVCELQPGLFYTISIISNGGTKSKKISVQ